MEEDWDETDGGDILQGWVPRPQERLFYNNGLLSMKITYDKIADAAYMTLRKGKVVKTVEMSSDVIVDLDKKGHLLGIEMLGASNQFSKNSLSKGIAHGIPIKIISRMPAVA